MLACLWAFLPDASEFHCCYLLSVVCCSECIEQVHDAANKLLCTQIFNVLSCLGNNLEYDCDAGQVDK